eukprot:87939-Pleurochrysis_carterae.AAC.1
MPRVGHGRCDGRCEVVTARGRCATGGGAPRASRAWGGATWRMARRAPECVTCAHAWLHVTRERTGCVDARGRESEKWARARQGGPRHGSNRAVRSC